MDIAINKKAGLSINQQLKDQISYLIDAGQLLPGEKIPASSILADSLNINRNTVSLVYHELENEGYLSCAPGRGTLVKARVRPIKSIDKITKIADKAFREAEGLGYSPEDFLKIASTQSKYYGKKSVKPARLLVLECNPYAATTIENSLKKNIHHIETDKVLISELKKDKTRAPALAGKFDYAVTEFSHLDECKALLGDSLQIFVVMISSRFRLLTELAALPQGTKVCHVCYTEASLTDSSKLLHVLENGQLEFINVPLSTETRLLEAIKEADVIAVSDFAYEKVKKMVGDEKKVIKVDMVVEPAGLKMIKEALKENETRA